THQFSVQGTTVPYSVSPGFVRATDDFTILADVYGDQSTVEVSFPQSRQVTLYPGTNYVQFSIGGLLGVQKTLISLGIYQIPAYIVGADHICGDGRVDGVEVCDGTNLKGKNCSTVGNFTGGELRCRSGCLSFDKSMCVFEQWPLPSEEKCDAEHLSLCLSQANCTGAGGYWYNNSCNEYEQGAVCDSAHVGLCGTPGTCLDAGGYWYNNSCNEEVQPIGGFCGDGVIDSGEECDGNNLSGANCTLVGFDGGNLSCNSNESERKCMFNVGGCFVIPPPEPPRFVIDPKYVDETIFIDGSALPYRFTIKNEGGEPITGLSFEFNPSKFLISPSYVESIDVNETGEFNVTLQNSWWGKPFRGAVVVRAGNTYEYVVLSVNFTEDESEAIRTYSQNSTAGPSYYCSQLYGVECGDEQVCNGDVVRTINVINCCVGTCESQGGGSGSWIGYLIAGIGILVVVIIWWRYSKAGKRGRGSPLTAKVSQMQKNLP
ncbi:MAG: hypothetical protein KKD18_02115, partial [Nanoarchaeota archaeon]|nr:hypothetical protein [Nanoarchaeota archaeon]